MPVYFFEPGKGKTYPVIDALKEIDKEKNGNTYVPNYIFL